ncbi:MAG TPA: histidine kinase [Thermoanaerobaculia bacterium]|nr:histidine kinase [Thermoanaerobaculia bacterium]
MLAALFLCTVPLGATVRFDDMSSVQEIGEVRFRQTIDLRKVERELGHPYGIYYGSLASHEIFWDGVRIGGGGIVGRTKAEEVPGPIEAHYAIPEHLATPGLHTLEMRSSAFHRGFSPAHGYWAVFVADYDAIVKSRTDYAHMALMALSGIVLTGVFAFAMFFVSRRDRSFLLLGTLCLAAAALLIAEAWRPLFGYTYDWHIVRLRCVVACSWLVGVQIVALVVTRFPMRHGRQVVLASAVMATIIPFIPRGWDPKSIYIFLACGIVASAWALLAVKRRMHGSLLALIGVGTATATIFLEPGLFLDYYVYFALDFLFVCLLISHALEVRRQHDEKARLEVEMVRRHLQPHFLMNTLTALSEWIEQEPKTAVRMIESLAEELRLLGTMSAQRLVTAGDELRLCETHLANMSLRKDIAYTLEVNGVDAERLVPPAVFHTLVENAVTHAPAAARVTLRLFASEENDRVRYVFESPAGRDAEAREGGGTRYIKARLREVWGDAWSLEQRRIGALWRAEIEVPA